VIEVERPELDTIRPPGNACYARCKLLQRKSERDGTIHSSRRCSSSNQTLTDVNTERAAGAALCRRSLWSVPHISVAALSSTC
jgi:hypothetical protein